VSAGGHALVAGGCLSLGVAALHAGIVIAGPAAYRYFGAGERMAALAAAGSPAPALITLGMTAVFAVMGLYALAGAGRLRRLPRLRTGLVLIGTAYTLRGLFLPLELRRVLLTPGALPLRELVFSAVSLVMGLLYLAGTSAEWRTLSARRAAGHRSWSAVRRGGRGGLGGGRGPPPPRPCCVLRDQASGCHIAQVLHPADCSR